uniref:serine/threonine protein kinase n=1 Tax=Actinoplanes palleronii TaxID=113570 RepID=UPI0023B35904|nr:serine/threonine protein kinase [Actinoplanes palleronii]
MLIAERYRLVGPLGQGGMGRVWAARDELLGRDVAIKELVPPAGLTEDALRGLRERSIREARAIAQVDQANVVRVFDVVFDSGDPWIVMELVPSRSLYDVLQAEGPMAPDQVARVGLGVLAALRAAHRAGLLHRDVKPGNVLLAHDGRVVLTDFGLATLAGDSSMTSTGVVLGSPSYLAPERALDAEIGPAADLWSLGATLYAAVEGRPPYAKSSPMATLAALATELPAPPARAGALRPALVALLQRDPAQRADAETAYRLLMAAAEQDGPAAAQARFNEQPFATPPLAAPAAAPADGATPPAAAPASGATPPAAAEATPVNGATPAAAPPSKEVTPVNGATPAATPPGKGVTSADSSATTAAAAGPAPVVPTKGSTSATADLAPERPAPAPAGRPRWRRRSLVAGAILLIVAGVGAQQMLSAPEGAAETQSPGVIAVSSGPALTPAGAPAAVPSARPTRANAPSARPGATTGKPAQPTKPPAGTVTVTVTPSTAKPTATTAATTTEPAPVGRQIRNHGTGTCLYAPSTTGLLKLWACTGAATQMFSFPADGTMRVRGQCAQISSTANGTQLRLAGCTGGTAQQFNYNAASDLTSGWGYKCLDVPDANTANGVTAQIWECSGADNQKWTY